MLAPMRALRLSLASLAVSALLIVASVFGACSTTGGTTFDCNSPVPGEQGTDGGPDPCHCNIPGIDSQNCECFTSVEGHKLFLECMSHLPCALNNTSCWLPCVQNIANHASDCEQICCANLADAGAEGPLSSCTGACLPTPPAEWTAPLLLWFGNETSAPACPDLAPAVVYEGHAGLDTSPATCSTCSCDPPTGSCALPATITASAAPCPGSINTTPFDPSSGWDGGCDTHDPVSPNKLCGGVPCVQSLTTAPLVLSESGCTPTQQIVPHHAHATWSTFARACQDTASGAWGTCAKHGETCAPAAAAGFRQCMVHEDDVACPSFSPYTEKHLFYGDADDTRSCSACSCDPPAGSTCAATLSIYGDGACSAQLLVLPIDSKGPECTDLPAGSALGSKTITPPMYTAGQCQPSGGEAMGAIEPTMPSTFCCLP